MTKRFSVCLPITGSLLRSSTELIKKLNKINKTKFITIPHINILSGNYKKEQNLIKKFKKISITKKTTIKLIGIGVFFNKKNIIHLRFEKSKFIQNLKKVVKKKIKIKNINIDYTATELLWMPVSTLCMTKFSDYRLLQSIKISKRDININGFSPKKLLLMDVTSSDEKVISENILKK